MSGVLAIALYTAAMLRAGGAGSGLPEMAASLAATAPVAWADAYLAGMAGGPADEPAGTSARRAEDPLRRPMELATALGSGGGLAAVVGVTALVDPGAALSAAEAGVGTGLVTLAHKAVLGRARPPAGAGPYTMTGPLSLEDLYQSLPSGHTSGATAVFGALGRAFPSAAPALEAVGVLVGLSRVYLGLHWPSDVAAGRGLGTWWAEAAADNRGGASVR